MRTVPSRRAAAAGLALLLVGTSSARAQCPSPPEELCLPRLFQDRMVLQRDMPIYVWGWAAPGTAVEVAIPGSSQSATADARGAWNVRFPRMDAGGIPVMTISGGGKTITIHDVAIGDVWVASGQSNMEWPLARDAQAPGVVAAARDPMLREFAVPHSWSERPSPDLAGGSWAVADPQHAGAFSAVGFYFARELRAALGVPIGIIHTSWGGANIETWLSWQGLGLGPEIAGTALQQERARQDSVRANLRARLGDVPAQDPGLVGGRALWADPALDDAAWTSLPVPSLWEQSGFEGLDGIAWYRTSFELSEAEARAGARLALGMIDDDDITWVNGVEVGRTTGYATPRVYDVPAAALLAGRNVLAVRVVDGAGGGGPYGPADRFYVEAGGARKPLPARWRFRVGEVALQPDGQRINKVPTVLYDAMINPLLRFPIKGAIWYQGESNANNDAQADAYRDLFARLIRSWRDEWRAAAPGMGQFPFLWVQLPNYGRPDTVPPASAGWARLRDAQSAALSLPGTAQAVAIELGDPGDIHPRDKQPVGHRLALGALRVAYGKQVVASGPVYRDHRIRNGRITIEFADGGSPLASKSGGDSVSGFAIAGADRRWVWAEARIEGNRVVAWSQQVSEPVAVRYAWSNSPRAPGLVNRAGLPATPFRTDDW